MKYKIKNITILSVLVNIIMNIVFLAFSIYLLNSKHFHLEKTMLGFHVFLFLWYIIYFISVMRNLKIKYKKVVNKYEASFESEVAATNISTFKALARLVDARDNYTGMHSSNVMKYTELICNRLNLSKEEKERILISANLHDIGKIGIDDSILKKEGKLTSEEYSKMKLHPVIGASIIGDIKGFEEISTIIKYHHERYDGKGYPEGLEGNEIPLSSQIIGIADTFDAITTNRVYRKSLGYYKAIKILDEEKGKQFNPNLVHIFLEELEKASVYMELEDVI